MGLVVYALCALTSTACAGLLFRAFLQRPVSIVLWTALCFTGLALNNLLLLADVIYALDLQIWRKVPAVIGVTLLLYGLITNPS